jgi:hypothetical protein
MATNEIFHDTERASKRAFHDHPAKMPVFPLGGWHREGPSPVPQEGQGGQALGFPCTAFLEQGLFTVTDRGNNNDGPLILSTRYAKDYTEDKMIMYDGTVVDSLAELGNIFTAAYNRVKPEPGHATLIHPNGYLTPRTPKSFPFREKFSLQDLCRIVLCEPSGIVTRALEYGPFKGYTLVRAAKGGIQCPLRNINYYPLYPLNPVASAMWMQSFTTEEKDEHGVPYFIQFLYGLVLLVPTDLIELFPKISEAELRTRQDLVQFFRGELWFFDGDK